MESQAHANTLSRHLASLSIAAEQYYSVPHDHTKAPPSTRADEDVDAVTQLICDITEECVALFKQFLHQPYNQLIELVSICECEFHSWRTSLRAFARESARRNIKWKLEPDIRDLVMPLLDILQNDLRLPIELESRSLISQHNPLSHGSSNTNSNDDSRLPLSNAARGAMEGVKGSVYNLRYFTTRIMLAFKDQLNLEDKIVDFAKQLPRDGFEDRTRVILKQKFPRAEERLITKLVKSIAFHCHHILYHRHHHKDERYVRHLRLKGNRRSNRALRISPHDHQDVVDTELGLSTNWMFFRTDRVDGQDDGCKQQAPTFFLVESLWLDEFGYPIPPKADPCSMSAMCQICLQELQVVGNEDPMWWKKHVESDMEHYTCLSDDCENSLCYFKSFDSWLEHMNREHLYDWPRCTYAKKIEWRCRVSDNCAISFDNEDLLRRHLVVNHLTDFELTDLQLVVEKSKFTQLRDPNICPLCEESINDSEPVIQQSSAENDGSHKKVRRQPDGQQSILGALQNGNEEKRPATNTNSSIRPNEMDLRMAAHIADHLKSVSLLCLGGLEQKGEERQEEDSGADMFGAY